MKLFPNPANQYIIVEYNLQDKFKTGLDGEITVISMQGQKVLYKLISKQQDQVLFSISSLPMGAYLCTLNYAGKLIETQRFIIER